MFKQGDKVRRITSRNAVDAEFDGGARQHGKKIGTVQRVYEDLGMDVCDIEFSDGTTETAVPVSELQEARTNVEN